MSCDFSSGRERPLFLLAIKVRFRTSFGVRKPRRVSGCILTLAGIMVEIFPWYIDASLGRFFCSLFRRSPPVFDEKNFPEGCVCYLLRACFAGNFCWKIAPEPKWYLQDESSRLRFLTLDPPR